VPHLCTAKIAPHYWLAWGRVANENRSRAQDSITLGNIQPVNERPGDQSMLVVRFHRNRQAGRALFVAHLEYRRIREIDRFFSESGGSWHTACNVVVPIGGKPRASCGAPSRRVFSSTEATIMRKLMTAMLAGAILGGLTIGMVGCTEEASVTKETTVKGPEGTAKTTEKTSVEKSGQNPPAAPSETSKP
jgi:hypothetical protein